MLSAYLGHSLKDIVVVLDSFLVEIVAIGCHMVAFLVVASHLVQPLVEAAHTYAVMVALDNFLVDFCRSANKERGECISEIVYLRGKFQITNLFS